MTPARRINPLEVNREFAISKCEYFVDVQLWPPSSVIDPDGWLSNFTHDELRLAINMLNAFMYLNDQLVDSLIVSAFQALSVPVAAASNSLSDAKDRWQRFFENVIVTYVEGEHPNPTDSGYAFARKARQLIEIPEERILHPDQVADLLTSGFAGSVVFVDDFVGTGNQMRVTWHRERAISNGNTSSFSLIRASRADVQFFYCPVVCTSFGRQILSTHCPGLVLCPAYELSKRYSLVHPDSVLWPEEMRADGIRFIWNASVRAGIPGNYEYGWRGLRHLGLALAIRDSVPDATLPLFFWDRGNWKPLIRRK